MSTIHIPSLRRAILGWYDARVRDLPWRGTRDPYRIWISEIMLQQTRAQAVKPYYEAFLRDWPTVKDLAAADLQQVLKRWEGLGYYSRARNLHRSAIILTNEMGGTFPKTALELRKLPGIGEYTAGMIASIAYDEASPAIDGNQIRVLSRLFEMDEPAQSAPGKARIRAHAMQLIDAQRPGDFNQALMDIGAEICLPRNPRCADCPAKDQCLARAEGSPERLPVLPEKRDKRVERRGVAVVICQRQVLVRQRAEDGLLGGLWEFPHFLDATTIVAMNACLDELGIHAKSIGSLPGVEHVFTHLIWRMTGRAFRVTQMEDVQGMRWVTAEELTALPMPVAMAKYRDAALNLIE
ncbi:A/G-specific adenine glycosylase [Eubacteriales bacterium OttesenSCG-928-N13]|nr:A/G-specific adenine glycosylase [Eubacteriales bacterium OttesenSCG-928-N13]